MLTAKWRKGGGQREGGKGRKEGGREADRGRVWSGGSME